MKRSGRCLLILALLVGSLIGGMYMLFRTPPAPGLPAPKPVITKFPHDLAGKWRARLVKVNPPRGSRPGWKASWMQTNFADFDAVIEIGKDFFVRRLAWVQLKSSVMTQTVEWTGPDSWAYLERRANKGQVENRGESQRKGRLLTVEYRGSPVGEVRECRFEYGDLPPVPAKNLSDGGFRESLPPEAIEAEVNVYAPSLTNVPLDVAKFRIEMTPFGFSLANNDFLILGIRGNKDKDSVAKLLHQEVKVPFHLLRKLQIDKVRGGILKGLFINGYPGGAFVDLQGCDCQFWFGDTPSTDRVFVTVDKQAGAVVLTKAPETNLRAKVVFSPDGTGRLFTHDGVMEYQLSR